jgi:ketosteroid isomerase-like protein
MPDTATAADPEVTDLVERFTAAWANPSVEAFAGLFHDDIVLEQPMLPRIAGKEAAVEQFRQLVRMFPEVRGEVLGWHGEGDRVFINLTLHTGGRRPLEWTVVDRIQIEDGLIRERISYFDSLPLMFGALTRPSLWWSLVRQQLRR